MSTRIAICGAGGVGGVIGGYLTRAGMDVTLIDMWPANIETIKEDGLTVTSVEEEFTSHPPALHLGEVSAVRRHYDIVFLSVKSYDTAWSTKFMAPHLAPGGYIVSAQNSINDDVIADIVGWTREVGCIVTIGAAMYEPAHAIRTSIGDRLSFKVGESSGLVTKRIEALAEILSVIGPTHPTTNLWGERWSKLAVNCMANAVAGMTGMGSAEVRNNSVSRSLTIKIAAELLTVATAYGVSVEPISGIPAEKYTEALDDSTVMQEVENTLVETSKGLGAGIPSLAQDVGKRRKTEIEFLNGLVARKGAEIGVATPVNDAIVRLTKRVEAGVM